MKTLRFFISSPGDVFEERAIANRVIERLQSEYIGKVVLEPVLWEHEPLVATSTFQHQIVKPSDTDVMIAILWSRLGTPLPKDFVRPDGTRFESGTEFEFEEAIEGFQKNGKPDLLVYRKTAPPSVRLDEEEELLERLGQKKKLDVFVDKWFHDKADGSLIAAFHPFESPSDFENLLEHHLHRLVERELPRSTSSSSEARAVWRKGSPFRGLEAFQFEHAPVFFGRTKAVSDILQALRDQDADDRSFVLVLGMSGGGKSSVVRAGVLPMLTRPGVIEGVDIWRRAVYRPTDVRGDLFTGLAKALLRDTALPSLDEDNEGPEELAQVLRESPQAATSMIKGALTREKLPDGKSANARLVLLVDQMEEMYTQEEIGQKERVAFVDVLDALARSGRVWVIGTLRSDFYQAVIKIPKIIALKEGGGQYDLMPPTASEIGQMIRLPTRAAGLRFEEDPASNERLDDMLRDAAAEHPEVLPLLQFTLEELYQRRTEDGMLTLAAYHELGGVEGSLAQRAETVFKDLPDDVEAQLPKVLNALVTIERDGFEQVGRKRASWTEVSTGKSHELVDSFVNNRLFVTELADDGTSVVTVAHEALLWHWPRVQEWVAQNRENLRIRGRIAAAAKRWIADDRPSDLLLPSGKPLVEAETLLEQDLQLSDAENGFINASLAKEKRFHRLKRGVFAALAMLTVLAATSAYLATQQRDLANQARTRAEVEAETAKQTANFMVDLFSVSDPSEARGNTITAREIMDKGASRVEQELSAQPAIQATLMETMGKVYTALGLYGQAVPLLKQALEIRRDVFGAESIEAASSMDRLGEVLKLKADYAPAKEFFEGALSIRTNYFGLEHADTARSVYELADLLNRTGDYENAELFYRQALDLQRKLHGENSAEVAQALEGLALNLYDQGNYDEPVPLMRQAVGLRRELHDGPHPDLAEAINNLGYLLGETGEYAESLQLFGDSLEMKRQLFGDAHPEIAIGLNNYAFALYDQGDVGGAAGLFTEALQMQRALLGNNHPDVALALSNLAYVTYEQGDIDTAISMERESLEVYRASVGDEHTSVAGSMQNLGVWLMENNEHEEAETLLRQAVEVRKSLFGKEHVDVAKSLTSLAVLLVETAEFEEARATASEARSIWSGALDKDNWRSALAVSAEGAALAGLGDAAAAEPLLLKGFTVMKNDSGTLPHYMAFASRWLADYYDRNGQPNKAAQYRSIAQTGG